ncbi:MAG TPA: hypothetical protein VGT41_01240 [Candidatus Babeliales bacterium]|nr:hypothetical protein [Candidatus Babeliales bacterium]
MMNKFMLVCMAALSSMVAQAAINLDIQLSVLNQELVREVVTVDEATGTWSCQQDGFAIKATVQDLGEEVAVAMCISGTDENGQEVIYSEPTMVMAWGQPGTLCIGEETNEQGEHLDVLMLTVTATR